MTASQSPRSALQPTGTKILEFHARNCQKCHGEEGELRSPGWAEGKSDDSLTQILGQMVTEQAGRAPLNESDMGALLAYHHAQSKAEPWANLISADKGKLTFETTRDSRLSAVSSGKKLATAQAPIMVEELGVKLMRWTLAVPASADVSKVAITVAKGEGKTKKVVSWKLSDSPYSSFVKKQ